MRKCVNWLFLSVAGLVLTALALVLHLAVLPIVVRSQVSKTLSLNNGTDAWERFVKLPVPVYLRVYFFNLENPRKVVRGEKPIFKEVGPWVYKETRERDVVELDDESDTVKYRQKSFYEFDADLSKPLREDDYVHPANIIPQLVNTLCERLPEISFLKEMLELGLPETLGDDYGVMLNRTVRDILFDGIEAQCPPNVTIAGKFICSVLSNFPGIGLRQIEPNGNINVAVLRFRNDTTSGIYEVFRGNNNFDQFGQIVTYNGQLEMTRWYGPSCNRVAGSYDESLLKPLLDRGSSFNMFAEELCTSTPMSYDSDTSYKGIDCFKFTPRAKFLGSVKDYPENYCYCPGSIEGITLSQGCMRTGALEFSACQAVPAILSFPHFYGASAHYQNAIDGLEPKSYLHESFVALEPTTGIPVKGAKRVQVNFELKGAAALSVMGSARDVLSPFIWIEEAVELPDDMISMLEDQLIRMMTIAKILFWTLIAVGALVTIVGLAMAYFSAKREHRHPD